MVDPPTVLWNFTDSGGSCSSSSSSVDDDPPFDIKAPQKQRQPIKKIRNVRKSNIYKCAVCGDKPTGYHYEVLSCNGCKTFFRRTMISKRKFTCARNGKCEFTKDFRCACRACRFSKCVAAGMNPNSIILGKGKKVAANEADGVDSEEKVQVEVEEETNQNEKTMSIAKPMKPEEADYTRALDAIVHREKALQTMRESDMPSVTYPDAGLDELFSIPSALGKRKQKNHFPAQLEDYKKHPVRFWMVADLYLTVEFAKTFPEFQRMSRNDKVNFMYNIGGLSQIITQAYYSLAKESGSLIFPDGCDAMHFQVVHLHQNDYELYYRECYCRPVDIIRALGMDLPEFVMFKTISLFSIEDELEAASQKRIKKKREELMSIFRRYLVQKYGLHRGTEKLALCLFTIKTFIEFQEKRRSHMFVADLMHRVDLSRIAAAIFLKKMDLHGKK